MSSVCGYMLFCSSHKRGSLSIQMDHHVASVCGSQKGLKGDIYPKDHRINMIKGSFLEEQTNYRIIFSLAQRICTYATIAPTLQHFVVIVKRPS